VKPTRGQIAQAFGVPAAAILDTSIRGSYPPLQWARAAFVGITFATSPRTYAQLAADWGVSIATPHRWRNMHETYLIESPKYARIFASLRAVSEVA
jgi:hypothetical protein